MKFTRTKKLLFANNKGGIGKTTLAFNCAVSFAKQDYGRIPAKCQEIGVAIFDLDPALIEEIHQGTKENIGKSKEEFGVLTDKILKIFAEY